MNSSTAAMYEYITATKPQTTSAIGRGQVTPEELEYVITKSELGPSREDVNWQDIIEQIRSNWFDKIIEIVRNA